MKQFKLTKDQIQKLGLSGIGFVALIYVYFTFFLGPLNSSRDTMLATITDVQGKMASSKNEMMKTANLEKQASNATNDSTVATATSTNGSVGLT